MDTCCRVQSEFRFIMLKKSCYKIVFQFDGLKCLRSFAIQSVTSNYTDQHKFKFFKFAILAAAGRLLQMMGTFQGLELVYWY